jgi:coatomer protein complex subunit alpha (xenin)
MSVDWMFSAPAGLLLLRSEDRVTLYDVQQKKAMAELQTPEIKFAFWSQDPEPLVALIAKDSIIIANRKLEQICSVHETIRIKSGAWDENGIFIYSTLNHIKYCLPNGDNGIVRTLDAALYITGVKGNKVYCLDRECKNRIISVDTTEYMFKYALIKRKYSQVLRMVKEYNLIGQAIISYLQKKGFPEVALHFVKDEKTRFSLALECGNIEVALESAKVLDDKDSWHQLGVEALRQGNHQIVEMAYQRTKNFERLSFLYLITGNIDKLRKMLKISEMRNDTMGRFHNALYLGDVAERVKLLDEVGQTTLAYTTAATHGLHEEAEALKAKLTNPLDVSDKQTSLLLPPVPILRLHESNWPLLTVSKGYFDGAILEEEKPSSKLAKAQVSEEELAEANWDDLDLDEDRPAKPEKAEKTAAEGEEAPGWDDSLDLDELKDIDVTPSSKGSTDKAFVVLPNPGPSTAQLWSNNSNLAADHVAAGSFESAMRLLNQQIGVVNFSPLKSLFMSLYLGSRAEVPTLDSLPAILSPLLRTTEGGPRGGLPALSLELQSLIENKLKTGYRSTTQGKFNEALQFFVQIFHSLPLIVVSSKKEANEAKDLLNICRDYVTGLRMELQRKDASIANDPVRQAELAAYFTHCNLESIHLMLSLRSAMTCAYKIKNYRDAASFARRLFELDPKDDVATQAKKVVKFCETNNENAHTLNYNERNPFVVCGISFTPIY